MSSLMILVLLSLDSDPGPGFDLGPDHSGGLDLVLVRRGWGGRGGRGAWLDHSGWNLG